MNAAFWPRGIGSKSTLTPSTPRRTTSSATSRAIRARAGVVDSRVVDVAVWAGDQEKRASEMTTFVPAAWARAMSSPVATDVQIRQRPSFRIAPSPDASRLKKTIVDTDPKSSRARASSTCDVVTKAITSPRRPFAAKPNFAGS